ncbi:MAG: Flp/Fap pilin component [Pseudomonadota bacterium]|jgi:pilus assembly protein Flp/PilA
MKFLVEKVSDFLADEQGATAVEYGIFVALIAAVIVALVSSVGLKVKAAFQTVLDAL